MSFSEELRDGRIGRFPVWAIGVIVAGLIIVFVMWRGRNRDSGESTSEAIPPLETVEGIPPDSFSDQITDDYPQNVSLAPLPQRPVTNAQWLIKAFDFLVAKSNDPALVQRALQKYLDGASLTDAERNLVGLATSNPALSLPPQGVNLEPATPPASTPPPAGTTPPATQAPTHVDAPLNTNLYTWADQIAAQYGIGVTFTQLFGNFKGDPTALNPTARNYMYWGDGPGYKIPVFNRTPPPIRIR